MSTLRIKGKLIKWSEDKAFGFIAANGRDEHVFIHKNALVNRNRTPKINDVITFTIVKDKQNRYCADQATFTGEKLKKRQANKSSKLSIYLSFVFLTFIIIAYFFNNIPQSIALLYILASVFTFIIYAHDKSKAQQGVWRTPESTLHVFALIGGWPGAAVAQQLLRHKSQKKAFRVVYWFTVFINLAVLCWLFSPGGKHLLVMFN